MSHRFANFTLNALLKYLVSVLLVVVSCQSFSQENIRLRVITNLGSFTLQLNHDKAPITVDNILKYVDEDYYSEILFHRIIKNFIVQTGGFTKRLVKKKPSYAAIQNEADNGLENLRGSIAMARTSAPHSATAQFFINTKNNPHLNHSAKSVEGWGYTVFGKVISGMNIVRRIERQATSPNNFPLKAIVIKRISRI